MSGRRFTMRLVGLGVALIGVLGGAFAAGRSTVNAVAPSNPLSFEHGVAIGVSETRAGALAAADNYAAAGVTASVDARQLRQFAESVIDGPARTAFLSASQQLTHTGTPPAGAHVIASVLGHTLERYGNGVADVGAWELASVWDGGMAPTQVWALVDLSLRWRGDRWWVSSVRESLPGPVPVLIAGHGEGRSSSAWDQALGGMAAPYYGDR